jgi:hypothetical protein
MTDNLEVLQQAIVILRTKQGELSALSQNKLTPEQTYVLVTSPALLSILRVTLKVLQISPRDVSTTGYGHEINLAKAIISASAPDVLIYPEEHPEEVDPD